MFVTIEMEENPTDLPFTLSTKSRACVRDRAIAYLVFVVMAAALTLVMSQAPGVKQAPKDGWMAMMCVPAVFLLIMMGATASTDRGTWIIDRDGVAYTPTWGRIRRIEWADVERVRWNHSISVLHDHSGKISIIWNVFPKQVAEAAKTLVEQLLSGDFDFSTYTVPSDHAERSPDWRMFVRLLPISLLIGIPYCIGLWFLALPQKPQASLLDVKVWLVWLYIFSPVVLVFSIAFRQMTRLKNENLRVNPNFPWRSRGWKVPEWAKKGKSLADSDEL